VFGLDYATWTLKAVWKVKGQLRALLRSGSLKDAAAAKKVLEELVKAGAGPETTGSTASSADGGKRSRYSSSPVPRDAR
jgi:hypothetical protein